MNQYLIMVDICDTVDALLDPSGDDYSLVTSEEKASGDMSPLSYADDDKTILWQFEAAVTPAKMSSKSLQDRRYASLYVLFEDRMAIQSTSANSFAIVSGKLFSLMFMTLLYGNAIALVGLVAVQHHGFEVEVLHSYKIDELIIF